MSFLKKTQVAAEFMLLSGMILIVSIIFISLSLTQIKELSERKEFFLAKDIALKIQNEIGVTSNVEDGYYREFQIPEKINNRDYNISIVNNTLEVWTNNTIYTLRILNITGNVNKGSNTIAKTNGITYLN